MKFSYNVCIVHTRIGESFPDPVTCSAGDKSHETAEIKKIENRTAFMFF